MIYLIAEVSNNSRVPIVCTGFGYFNSKVKAREFITNSLEDDREKYQIITVPVNFQSLKHENKMYRMQGRYTSESYDRTQSHQSVKHIV